MDLNKRASEMRDFFNEKINEYDERHLKVIKGKEKIIDFLPETLERIVDLGTGTGLQLIKLYKVYPNVKTIAIDVSEEMLKKLEERNISDKIVIINQSFFEYDFGNNINDAVISTQALHHFRAEDKIKLYTKVFNSLKENGIFVNEDYFASDETEEKMKFDEYEQLTRGEKAHYDTPLTVEHEIVVLKKSGFNIVNSLITDEYKIIIAQK